MRHAAAFFWRYRKAQQAAALQSRGFAAAKANDSRLLRSLELILQSFGKLRSQRRVTTETSRQPTARLAVLDLDVFTAADDPALEVFNPFTETPVEGVHDELSETLAEATNHEGYQLARTYRVSLGLRF